MKLEPSTLPQPPHVRHKAAAAALGLALVCAGGAAQAQSRVQLFGVIDSGITHLSSSGSGSLNQLGADGNTSSRLGFRGTEDLGGGLKASFWLEAAYEADTGAGGSTSVDNMKNQSGGLTFGRRSTVSLSGDFGEVRLGRDFVPGFSNLAVSGGGYHAFGTNGVGSSAALFYPPAGARGVTHVRASNSIAYHMPKMGGFFGTVMYGFSESMANNDGRVIGARVGYASGPLSLAVATTKTTHSVLGDLKQSNIGASYDFGVVKPMLLLGENKAGDDKKTRVWALGAHVPVGSAGQFRVSYGAVKATNVANDANHIALGYVHNLSKRTALYGNVARVKNKDGGKAYTVGDGLAVADGNGSGTGYQVGIRHSF
ncbi:porin [Comamonas odontotermitis]|uniref:porin n=1 Tax=Comamonas odontotermitis TaxID=379895 RepID=UPI001CC49AFA|nr:porin [Comamonas odontotermitis]UBB15314.1 porin [Comamonas odontotermitis]